MFSQSLVAFTTEWQFKESQTMKKENARVSYKYGNNFKNPNHKHIHTLKT